MTVAELIEKLSTLPQDQVVELKMPCPGTDTTMQSDARTVMMARDGTVFVSSIEDRAENGSPSS